MTTTRINTSLYPSSIDTDRSIPHMIDDISEVRAISHNVLKDAILAIQTSLGVDPQGAFATLALRLVDLEDTIGDDFVSSRGDTMTGPGDSDTSIFPSSIDFTFNDEGLGNDAATLTFGEDCNCSIILDNRSAETGTVNAPTTSTRWLPTSDEIINNGSQSVVPLTILGNSAYGSDLSGVTSPNLHRRIRIFDDMEVVNSLRVKDYIRAKNVDVSIDNLYHKNLRSKIARKAVLFSADPGTDLVFGAKAGSNLIWNSTELYVDGPANMAPTTSSMARLYQFIPVQPKVFGSGNMSVDGDVEVQGTLKVSDYMEVVAAQTAVAIDDINITVPASTFKRNVLFITFSANILDVTEDDSRGGIQLLINGSAIDHPMIYKGVNLVEDDINFSIIRNLDSPVDMFPLEYFTNPIVEATGRNRLTLSPDGSYSGMATAMILSGATSSGVSENDGLPRFNPEVDNVITLRKTNDGISSLMHTVVVWATGATNVEVVTDWVDETSTPVLADWTPTM